MITEFIIERDIPIPSKIKETMPFKDMEVGDSFFIKTDKPLIQQIYASARIKRYNKLAKTFIKIRTAKVEGGIRVWRIR